MSDSSEFQEDVPGEKAMATVQGLRRRSITPTQERAIAALLISSTLEEAAKTAGISSSTLRRWRSDPDFVKALDTHRIAMLEGVTARIRGAAADAIETVRDLAKNGKSEGVRLRAATTLLTMAYRSAEVDELATRLHEIEGWVKVQEAMTKALRVTA